MTITLMGWVVIPLTLAIFFVRPTGLIGWTILLAVFQGASVLNWGSGNSTIGIAPYYFAASLAILHSMLVGESFSVLSDTNHTYLTPLLLFTPYAIGTSFLLPQIHDHLMVDNWRAGRDIYVSYQTPLKWSVSNLAQAIYLTINFGLVTAIVARARRENQLYRWVRMFYWSGMIVIGVGIYQEAAFNFGLPFPSEFFNSNTAGTQLYRIVLANLGIERLSATFSEPSFAGAFLAAWLVFVLLSPRRGTCVKHPGSQSLAGLLALAMTVSSIGYAAFATALSILMTRSGRSTLSRLRISRRGLALMVMLVFTVGAMAVAVHHPLEALSFTFFEKVASISTISRLSGDADALRLFAATFGLGVGLGSDNSSSFATSLLANLGIPGTCLFIFILYRALAIARRGGDSEPGDARIRALRGAFLANLFAMILAISELMWPPFWIILALLLAECRASSAAAPIAETNGKLVNGDFADQLA